MKKIFIPLVCLALAFVTFASGCGCSGASPLTFTNGFYSSSTNANVPNTYSETLVYKVSYINNDQNYPSLTMPSDLAKKVTPNYVGTYTTTLRKVPYTGPQSDIYGQDKVYNGLVYRLTSSLNILATYNVEGEDQPRIYNDYINTSVYFCPQTLSFAPIYATSTGSMTLVNENGAKITTQTQRFEYTTLYNQNTYLLSKVVSAEQDGEFKEVINSSLTYPYVFKTIIDNTQFLFSLRNAQTTLNSSITLPVISPAYGVHKLLSVQHKAEHNEELSKGLLDAFTYNGNTLSADEKMPVKKMVYAISSLETSGRTQYVTMQTKESTKGTVPNKALMTEYVEPLFAYGSMSTLGGLKYTLTTCQISE